MKVGTTAILLVELDVDVTRVSKVIWTLKTPNATVQKEYPTDVTYADKHFGIPLTQQETTSLGVGTVKVEGQINYTDLAVTKTITAHFKMHETIATSLVTGNKPNGDTDISELRIKLVGEAIVAYTDGSGGSGGSGTSWGNITGTLSAQTDLKNALDGKANVNQIPSLTGYATENYVTNAISDKADRSEIPSLTGYATQSWVQNQGYTTSEIDDNTTGVTNTWSASKINQNLSNLNSALASKANTSDIPSLSGYATQSWVESKGYLTECRASIETEVPSDDEFLPNVFYQLDELEELYIALAEPTDTTHLNEYMVEFVSGATATNFSYDITSITFMSEPTIEANKKYQISIVNGIGLLVGVDYE